MTQTATHLAKRQQEDDPHSDSVPADAVASSSQQTTDPQRGASRPRSGRALALWRRSRAVELALSGWSYDDIAADVGYANRGTAWHVVTDALAESARDGLETHRTLELARLDRVLAAHWPEATSGANVRAAELVLKVVAQRTRLLGLDAPAATHSDTRTLVVSSEHYVQDLKRIVGAEHEPD